VYFVRIWFNRFAYRDKVVSVSLCVFVRRFIHVPAERAKDPVSRYPGLTALVSSFS
jgi:hypothetical protein